MLSRYSSSVFQAAVYIDASSSESILRMILLWEKIWAEWSLTQEELVIVLLAWFKHPAAEASRDGLFWVWGHRLQQHVNNVRRGLPKCVGRLHLNKHEQLVVGGSSFLENGSIPHRKVGLCVRWCFRMLREQSSWICLLAVITQAHLFVGLLL